MKIWIIIDLVSIKKGFKLLLVQISSICTSTKEKFIDLCQGLPTIFLLSIPFKKHVLSLKYLGVIKNKVIRLETYTSNLKNGVYLNVI